MKMSLATLRQSWRAALRKPAFLTLAGTTLALGIAAATAVFALVNTVLLAPPPYPQPERLMVVGNGYSPSWSTISPQQYQMLEDVPGIVSVGAHFVPRDVNVAGGGDPELASAWPADAGLLATLGMAPVLGRNFSAEEDRPGGPRAVILGHAFWQRHFGGAADVIGRSLLVDGVATPVVGVLPASFRLNGTPDLLLPLALPAASTDGSTNLLVLARLAEGTSQAAASQAIDTRLQARLRELGFSYANLDVRFSATPLATNLGASARPVLLLFLACAGCVLLLVAVNLANLMLLRALGRGHDSAVRAALGASRLHLALPAFAEGLLVGAAGAVGGLLLAALGLALARAWLPAGWLHADARLLGPAAVAFAAAMALAVAMLASLFGIWRGRDGTARELAAGARGGASHHTQRFGRALVVAQAGLATVLLASSALLAHSLWKLSRVDPGFDAGGVIVFRLNPAPALYPDVASVHGFTERLLERLRSEPGLESAAMISSLPVGTQFNIPLRLPDGSSPPQPQQYRIASPGVFATFRIPLLAGRDFAEADGPGSEPVAIVNQAFARQHLGGNALGQRIAIDMGGPMPPMRIVGVVGDVRQFGPQEEAPPILYAPQAQVPERLFGLARQFVPQNVAVRVSGAPAAWFGRLRTALREVDARQGLAGLRLFERDLADATAPQRMNAVLVGLFATLALVLAAVGLYSVTAVAVAARRREYGVRAALGAAPARLLRGVVARGLADVGLGIAIGLALALAAARLLDRFLFGVGAADPLALAATVAVLLAAGITATALPALRAARTAPMTALRND